MLGCMYIEKVTKSFFIKADAMSIACTLMVVERFCPGLAIEINRRMTGKKMVWILFIKQNYKISFLLDMSQVSSAVDSKTDQPYDRGQENCIKDMRANLRQRFVVILLVEFSQESR